MKKIFLGLLLFISCLSIFLFKPPKVNAYSENYTSYTPTELDGLRSEYYLEFINFGTYGQTDDFQVSLSDIYIFYSIGFNEYNELYLEFTSCEFTLNVEYNNVLIYSDLYNSNYTNAYLETFLTYGDFISINDIDLFNEYFQFYLEIYLYEDKMYFMVYNSLSQSVELLVPVTDNLNGLILLDCTLLPFDNLLSDIAYQFYIENTTYHPEPLDPNVDMWTWLGETIGGFMDFEIFPSFSIGAIFNIVISIALFLIFLKVFVGG